MAAPLTPRRLVSAAGGVLLAFLCIAATQAQAPRARTRILLDEAHHNLFAAAAAGYRPFVRLVTDAGFFVTTNSAPFSAARLATIDILLITHPNGADAAAAVDARARPAFTSSEVDAVQEWVEGGGALLLITDHYPTGAAARALVERFGVDLSAGWTDDPANRRTVPGYGAVFGYLVFSRSNDLIGAHPITDGREASERVRAITTTTGESIAGPPSSSALLRLSPTARDWLPIAEARRDVPNQPGDFNPCPSCATRSAAGRSQAIAFEFGRGRVVVIGEMGVLTDYSVPDADNRKFTLNVVRWLAREL